MFMIYLVSTTFDLVNLKKIAYFRKGIKMISGGQLRAARAFLNWSQAELAVKSGLSVPTIKRMESAGPDNSTLANVKSVMGALELAGCTFLTDDGNGVGVRAKGQS